MPLILKESMTDTELLQAVANAYADPANYEPFEKCYGHPKPAIRSSWIRRDCGSYAAQALEIIKGRKDGKT